MACLDGYKYKTIVDYQFNWPTLTYDVNRKNIKE